MTYAIPWYYQASSAPPEPDLAPVEPLFSGQESAYVMVLGEHGLIPPNAADHIETPPGATVPAAAAAAAFVGATDLAPTPTWPIPLPPPNAGDHAQTPPDAQGLFENAQFSPAGDFAPIPTWPIPVPPYGIEDSMPPFIIQLQDQGSTGGGRIVDWPSAGVLRVRIRRVSGSADTRLAIQGSSISITYHERT